MSLTGAKRLAQAECAVLGAGQLDIGAGEVLRAGQQPKVVDFGGQDDLFGRGIADENVIDRVAVVVALKSETGRGIGLGIAVDEKHFEFLERQAGGEINRGGSFADSALLIDNAENLAHGISE